MRIKSHQYYLCNCNSKCIIGIIIFIVNLKLNIRKLRKISVNLRKEIKKKKKNNIRQRRTISSMCFQPWPYFTSQTTSLHVKDTHALWVCKRYTCAGYRWNVFIDKERPSRNSVLDTYQFGRDLRSQGKQKTIYITLL
jgi:hypothetical protein